MTARYIAAVGVVAAMPLLSACGDVSADPSAVRPSFAGPLPSVAASAPESARAIADREAVAAYSGMIRTWVEAAKTSNAGSKELRRYAQRDALNLLASHLYAAKLEKKVALGEPGSSPAAIDARPVNVPTTVVVRDCFDSTRWLEYKESGELWDDKPGDRREFKAIVLKTKTGWKVDAFVAREVPC